MRDKVIDDSKGYVVVVNEGEFVIFELRYDVWFV